MIETVLVIFTPRQETHRFRIRHFGIQQPHFTGCRAGKIDHGELPGGGRMEADVEGFILLLVDQHIGTRRSAHGMPPDLVRQQRSRVLADIPQRLRIIAPGEFRRNVFQHFRIPFAILQIAQAQAILPTGEIILRQRHHRVIRRNAQPTESIEFALRRALVAIEQHFPFIPLLFQHRLTLINSVFTARLIHLTIAVAIFAVGRGDFARRDTVNNLF